ncbi:hypothetical protein C8Q72DRAFT_867411 [Fomitopsis betulina]|nr:hypothetical protein C8Q72DRAFT_867411 [Fomitopsis betulina]
MVSTPGSGSDGISSPTGADSMSDAELSSESDEHNTVPEDDDSGIAPPMQLPDQSLRIRLPPLRRHPHLSEGLQENSSILAEAQSASSDSEHEQTSNTACICGEVGNSETMIRCKGPACGQWFHYACVNLTAAPEDTDWFCDANAGVRVRKGPREKKKIN